MPLFESWVLPGQAAPADAAIPIAHPALRRIFVERGIADLDSFRLFVSPSVKDLHDPASIHGMEFACQRIERAVACGEAIVIYGDYDVDGVTSIVLLQSVLRALGADVRFVIPHRLVDGYGLKTEVLDRVLVDANVKLVITVDCGITSVEPVRQAIAKGIDVIITDHHLPPGTLPSAAAVLNPKQPGCNYPFKDLAGVGVAFKLCCELIRRNGKKISIESLLKIAAIGTIADVAPLIGENRTIAQLGLAGLADVRNPGLRTLLRRIGIYGRKLRATDVGFKIGPRINAAGRLASADTAIDLFAATDEEQAWEICGELERLNAERQQVEQQVRESAEAMIRGDERVLIVASEGWHRGVLGLTAARLAQKWHRPALAIAIDGDVAVGSARSIRSIDLHEQLDAVSDLFTHFGGHEYACGFSLPAARLSELRERLCAAFDAMDEVLFLRAASIDGVILLNEIDREFVSAHEMLEPFGAGNPQPMFLTHDVRLGGTREFAPGCVEVTLESGGTKARGVVWPSAVAVLEEMRTHEAFDVCFQLEPDAYAANGARLVVVDVRAAAAAVGASA